MKYLNKVNKSSSSSAPREATNEIIRKFALKLRERGRKSNSRQVDVLDTASSSSRREIKRKKLQTTDCATHTIYSLLGTADGVDTLELTGLSRRLGLNLDIQTD